MNPHSGYSLRKIFPTLAHELEVDLRRAGRRDLSDQVSSLQILDRCRCGEAHCGTLICRLPDENRLHGRHEGTILLEHGANVDVAEGVIMSVETLSPEINAVLVGLFP